MTRRHMNVFNTGCPKCGSKAGYTVRVRPVGYALHKGDWDTQDEKLFDESELRFVADKTATCLECKHKTYLKTLRAR